MRGSPLHTCSPAVATRFSSRMDARPQPNLPRRETEQSKIALDCIPHAAGTLWPFTHMSAPSSVPLTEERSLCCAGHKAKNLVPEAGARSTQVGLKVKDLQTQLPQARVVYCSATGEGSA